MTTTTHEARHAALIDYLADLLRQAFALLLARAPVTDEEDDIDWEDGEPDDITDRAA